ncbi:hypothetical protein T05_9634 [Trichinella murrelli]|uniref:Uncharacterized protein n=1 Tax=Trichinella murrelli TaxID=144512 RepID=A0A0V0TBG7_9BILA|nr:hypothetical protein T05_9634 [Trichinella murrelli]
MNGSGFTLIFDLPSTSLLSAFDGFCLTAEQDAKTISRFCKGALFNAYYFIASMHLSCLMF